MPTGHPVRPILIGALVFVLLMSGCTAEPIQQVHEVPDAYHTVIIATFYDAAKRSTSQPGNHEAVDLPRGHGASGIGVRITYPDARAQTTETWPYDEPCPTIGDPEHARAECDGWEPDDVPRYPRKEMYVPVSPQEAPLSDSTGMAGTYPLDEDGRIVLRFPTQLDFTLSFDPDARYPEALLQKAEDPDGCRRSRADPQPGGHSASTGVQWLSSGAARVSGDASWTIVWYGVCTNIVR